MLQRRTWRTFFLRGVLGNACYIFGRCRTDASVKILVRLNSIATGKPSPEVSPWYFSSLRVNIKTAWVCWTNSALRVCVSVRVQMYVCSIELQTGPDITLKYVPSSEYRQINVKQKNQESKRKIDMTVNDRRLEQPLSDLHVQSHFLFVAFSPPLIIIII